MKALIQELEGRLRRLPPFTITAIGLCWVLAIGVIDYLTPGAMSFVLFYLPAVVFTGWRAGKWHAWFVSLVAALTMLTVHYYLRRGVPQSATLALWNYTTRFVVFSVVGWLMAEVARLTRHLSNLVEERTAQWKAEAQEHKSTSARLAEANERFEQVINNITEVFWLTDVSRRQMIYVSPGYERLWGRKCEEVCREPLSWLAAVHPADRDAVVRCTQTTQLTGPYDVEYRVVRPDGKLRWMRDRGFPVRNAQGEVYRIAGFADDITERKQAHEALETQAAILQSMAEGVVVSDEQGRTLQMNPAAEQLWGYQQNELLGQPSRVLGALLEPGTSKLQEEARAALQAAGAWRGTFKDRRKDGEVIHCEAVVSRVESQGRTLFVSVEQDVTERLRIQEQLQMQARVLENMAEAVLVTDEQGTILLTNPGLDTLMSYERGELLGQSIGVLSVCGPEEPRRVFDRLLEQIKTHGLICGERLARRKDGAVLEIQCCSSGFTLDGRFYTVIVGQDITKRKRAEQALRQSEESLRVFLDATPQPALLLDREGVILLANQAASAGLGIPHNKLTGQNVFGLLTPPASQNRKAAFDQVLRIRKPIRFEDERQGRHYITFFSPVLDAAGNVIRVAVFALDFTERKQAEEALARKEELYRTLFELSPDGIVVGGASGTILDANLAVCQAFGYSRKELLGRNVRCLAPSDQQDAAEAELAALRAGQMLLREFYGIRKDGDRRLISLHAKPLLLPDGRPGMLAVTRDITETKRAELITEAFLLLATELNEVDSPLAAGRAIVAAADRLWQWDAAVLQLYSVERDCLDSVLLIDTIAGKRCEVSPPTPDSPPPPKMRRIMEQGAELILRTPAELQPNELVAFGDVQRLSASLMYAPLRRKGQIVGVLSIQSYTPNAFTEADLRTLEALADQCGSALDRLRAEQAAREAHTALEQRVRERTAELQTANAALQESQARLQLALREQQTQLAYIESIYQTAPVGLCVLDTDFRYVRINNQLASLNRLPVHQHLGRTVREVLPDLAGPAEEVFRQVITTGEPVLNFESQETTQGQADVPRVALVHWAPLKAADGQVTGVSVVIEEITERRRAERALREAHDQLEQRVRERTAELQAANAALSQSEERYRSLINNLNVGIFRNTPDSQGRFLQANPSLARILGYDSVAEVGQLRVEDTYRDPSERATFLADVLREGSLRNYELHLKKKDGTPIYASANATVHRQANGKVDWLDGVLEDITQQKLAQEARRASEERYRTLAETSPDAIFILDRNSRVEFVNSAGAANWGRQPADLIGRSLAEIFPPAVAQRQSQVVAGIFANGGMVHRDLLTPLPGGERWLETRLTPIRDAQGAVATVMGVSRDITERKQAEEALARKEELYRTLFELSPDGIVVGGASGTILDANQAVCQAFGYSRKELLGRKLRCLVPPDQQDAAEAELAALRAGQTLLREFYGIRKDGDRRLTSLHAKPLLLPDGRPGVLAVTRDITETKRAELIKEAFLSLGTKLGTARTPAEAARAIYASADLLWKWDSATLDIYSPETDQMEPVLNCDVLDGQRREFPSNNLSRSVSPGMRRVLQEGPQLMLRDPSYQPAGDFFIFGDVARPSVSVMVVPLRQEDRHVGILSIQSYSPNAFTPEDLGTLQALADHCSGALERIRAEQALADALDLNRRMLEASPLGIGAFNASGECRFVNQAMAVMAGGTVPDMMDMNFRQIQSWQETGLLQLAEQTLTRGEPQASEIRGVSSFGKPLWADVHLAPFSRGGELHLLCMVNDISDRKQAEEALRMHALVLQAMAEGVFLVAPDGTILLANPAAESMFGYQTGELLGQKAASLNAWHPEVTAPFAEEAIRTAQRGGIWSGQCENRRKDGTCFTSEARVSGLNLGGQLHYVSVQQDITERQRAELFLQAQRDLGVNLSQTSELAEALKCLLGITMRMGGLDSGAIYLLNEGNGGMDMVAQHGTSPSYNETVAHWGPDSVAMPLVRRGQPIFATFRELSVSQDEARQREGLRAVAILPLQPNRKLIGALCLGSHTSDDIPAATRILIEAIAAQAAGAIARIQAEEDRCRLERQVLEIGDRQQARIGQDIHDGLCQHLVSLAIDANSLHRDLSRKHHAQADRASRIALYLDHAITEARQLSRGLFPVRLATEGLVPALEELVNATARRFRIQCRFSPPESAVVADSTMATHLYRIAQEAVANAVKHSQARNICIRLCNRDERIELSIEDDGRGFSEAKRSTDGGMGLHIMDYRARAIGGTLRIDRSRRGGTVVSCCVPLHQEG